MKIVIFHFWRFVGFAHLVIMDNKFSKGCMTWPNTGPISRTIKYIYFNCIFRDCPPIAVCWLTIFDTSFIKDSLTTHFKMSYMMGHLSAKDIFSIIYGNPDLEELVTLNRYRNKPIRYVQQSFSNAKHDDAEF